MITKENIASHELIGLSTKVIESSNPQIIGLNGSIIDETKSMFSIQTTSGIKKVPKKHCRMEFALLTDKITIDGNQLAKRPYDRMGVKA